MAVTYKLNTFIISPFFSFRKSISYFGLICSIAAFLSCIVTDTFAYSSKGPFDRDSIRTKHTLSNAVEEDPKIQLTVPSPSNSISNPPAFSVTAAILNATCSPTNSGSIDITVLGGTGSYGYLWSNGSTDEDLTSLEAGTYTVTVTDINNSNVLVKGFQVRKACLTLTKELVSEPINNDDGTYTLTYTIKIYNAGDIGLTQVIVRDSLIYTFKEGSFFTQPVVVSQEFVVNEFFDGIEEYQLINETYDVLAPEGVGYITFTLTVQPRDKDEVYTNIAYFSAYDIDGMYIAGESNVSTVTFSDRPDLELTKVAEQGSYNEPGDTINYIVTVVNTGNVTLTSVNIDDPLTGLSETVPLLGVGQRVEYSTVYTVTQLDIDSGMVTNTATATGIFNTTIVGAEDTVEVPADQYPAISIQKIKRDTTYRRIGDQIHFELVVTNTGNVTLTNVLVTDPLTQFSQTISTLTPSSTLTLTTVFTVTQVQLDAGSFTNTATASSTFSATTVTDTDDESVTGQRLPALAITKTARKSTFSKSGEIITYDIVVRNSGNVSLYNVLVADPLTGLSTTIPFLSVGGIQLISTNYTIKQPDVLAKFVNNTATARGVFYGRLIVVSDNEQIRSSQRPPIAIDDRNTTLMSVSATGNVLINDSDPDGDMITLTQFLIFGRTYTPGSTAIINGVGTIVLNANGTYTFIPLPTYVGLVPLIRYTITDGNGNTARAVLRIQVIPIPNPPQLFVSDTSVCENQLTTLLVSSINVVDPVYSWYADSLLTNLIFTGPNFTTPPVSQTTVYYVRLNGSNLLPSLPPIVKKITIGILPLPPKPVVTIMGRSILCPGDSTILVSSMAQKYQWYKDGQLIPGATNQMLNVKGPGVFSVKTAAANGCESSSSGTVSIGLSPLPPTPTIVSDKPSYCVGDTAVLTASSSPVNYWYRNEIRLQGDSGKVLRTTLPGNYTVISKNQNGCISSRSNSINLTFNEVPPKPIVTIDGPVIFCEGDYRILKTVVPAGFTVQWYRDDVLMDGKTKDTLRITLGGKYTVRYTNSSGCVSPFSDCICTEIKCKTDIQTPDIFTPNDDDINDVIKPSIPGIRKFICFKVYNRWGNLVFYTTDPSKGWDGKYKGLNQPAESYMWIVEGFDSQGKKIKKSGMLSLMR